MGFKCLLDGMSTYSFALDDDDWYKLKENYKTHHLVSPCCNTPYIPKENLLGTRFFAHKSLDDCPYSDKTPKEHQYFKYLLSRTLTQMGWKVEHDYIGTTPSGTSWMADIYAEKNNVKFIFEVVWHDIETTEISSRQKNYQDSGIKSAWFLSSSPSKGVPYNARKVLTEKNIATFLFRYEKDDEVKKFNVLSIYKPAQKFTPTYSSVKIEVTEFIRNLFNKRIHIFGIPRKKYNLSLQLLPQTCFYCGNKTNLIQKVAYSLIHDGQPVKIKVMEIYEPPFEHIQLINTPEFRHRFQFGELGMTTTEAHSSLRIHNTCYHCNAIQESSSNLALFNSKNVFETNYIEVVIPDNYGENQILYILGSQ